MPNHWSVAELIIQLRSHFTRQEQAGHAAEDAFLTPAMTSALAGTFGTPGASNRYVSDADPRLIPTQQLVVENRTDDPASPATGRMWLRTDL